MNLGVTKGYDVTKMDKIVTDRARYIKRENNREF